MQQQPIQTIDKEINFINNLFHQNNKINSINRFVGTISQAMKQLYRKFEDSLLEIEKNFLPLIMEQCKSPVNIIDFGSGSGLKAVLLKFYLNHKYPDKKFQIFAIDCVNIENEEYKKFLEQNNIFFSTQSLEQVIQNNKLTSQNACCIAFNMFTTEADFKKIIQTLENNNLPYALELQNKLKEYFLNQKEIIKTNNVRMLNNKMVVYHTKDQTPEEKEYFLKLQKLFQDIKKKIPQNELQYVLDYNPQTDNANTLAIQETAQFYQISGMKEMYEMIENINQLKMQILLNKAMPDSKLNDNEKLNAFFSLLQLVGNNPTNQQKF